MSEYRGPAAGPETPASTDLDPSTGPPSERLRTLDATGPAAGAVAGSGPAAVPPHRAPRHWALRLVRAVAVASAGLVAVMAILILALRFVEPPTSAFMLGLRLGGEPIDRIPVPIDRVSPHLIRAVIASEDGRYCRHRGVDWGALAEAINDTRAGLVRGGSTIAMQTAKNLFLWSSRSYVRKALEIPLALAIDFTWGKQRVLEVYLNIAEWGPGIFGAEAAAQYHFNKSAAELSLDEATLLAASLPNPIARDAGEPAEQVRRLALRLKGRMGNADLLAQCVLPRAG